MARKNASQPSAATLASLYQTLAARLQDASAARFACPWDDLDSSDPASIAHYADALDAADRACALVDVAYVDLLTALRASTWRSNICSARALTIEAEIDRRMARHTHRLLELARGAELRALLFCERAERAA